MISPKIQQDLFRSNSRAMYPYLIEITHEDYGVFRYANSDVEITFNGEKYLPSFFQMSPPKKEAGSVGNAQLSISAIDQEWIIRIRGTRKRAKIKFVASYVELDGKFIAEAIEEYEFILTNASWTDTVITWDLVFDETQQLNVPCDTATAQKVPGIA